MTPDNLSATAHLMEAAALPSDLSHEPGMIRSRLMGAATWLRARPWGVFGVGVVVTVAFLGPFTTIDATERFIRVPAAIVSVIVVGGALIAGPRVGIGLALVCGALFDALVFTERWLIAGVTTASVLVVWVTAGTLVGMLGDRYRTQVTRSLTQAHRARAAIQRVLEATPAFHSRGSSTAVAQAICKAARETFECDLAALFDIEGDRLRLLARAPNLKSAAGTEAPLELFPDLSGEVLAGSRPSFVDDLERHPGANLVRDVAGASGQVAVLRVPVVLERRPAAILTLSWTHPVAAPDPERFAVVQRFVEHAAVALEQARRREAQREASALYRRFQASLVPTIDIDDERVVVAAFYRPGERRMLLGGDFVDVVRHDDGTLSAVIGDVTGHGPDAAALGSSLRAAWRALALRRAALSDTLETLNVLTLDESERAEAEAKGVGLMATMCAVQLNPVARTAAFAVAGHPPPLFLGKDLTRPLPGAAGLALGVERSSSWDAASVDLGDGRWGLLLYTDGLIEARRSPGAAERLGVQGLTQRVRSRWQRAGMDAKTLRRLVDDAQQAQGERLGDDVTLLLIAARG